MAMRQRQVKNTYALDQPTMDDMMITWFNEVSNRILSLCHPPYDNSGILRAAKMQDAIHVGEIVQRKTWLMRSKETEVKKQLSMFVIFDAFRMPFLLYQAFLRFSATLRYPHALHDGVTVVSSSSNEGFRSSYHFVHRCQLRGDHEFCSWTMLIESPREVD